MDITLYLSFLIISFLVIIVPGPNVLVIVSTSLAHGVRRGLQTVAGTSSAMTLQLLVVGVGTAWFVRLVADGLYYLKWVGIVYLLYLGLRHLAAVIYSKNPEQADITASATFARGFVVSLTNPKTLLFFSAFLPQFISATGDYTAQMLWLSTAFVVMATVLDSCYALLSSRLRYLSGNRDVSQNRHGFSGLLYLAAGAWLAASNR